MTCRVEVIAAAYMPEVRARGLRDDGRAHLGHDEEMVRADVAGY